MEIRLSEAYEFISLEGAGRSVPQIRNILVHLPKNKIWTGRRTRFCKILVVAVHVNENPILDENFSNRVLAQLILKFLLLSRYELS